MVNFFFYGVPPPALENIVLLGGSSRFSWLPPDAISPQMWYGEFRAIELSTNSCTCPHHIRLLRLLFLLGILGILSLPRLAVLWFRLLVTSGGIDTSKPSHHMFKIVRLIYSYWGFLVICNEHVHNNFCYTFGNLAVKNESSATTCLYTVHRTEWWIWEEGVC